MRTWSTHPPVRDRYTALADASAIVGSHATRHVGTLGGNVMNASPAMETGGPLICFGANAVLASSRGERRVPVADLLVGPGRTSAEPDELLSAIELPVPARGTGSSYVRLEYRRHMEIAVVGATCVVKLDGDRVAEHESRSRRWRPRSGAWRPPRPRWSGPKGDDAAVRAAADATAEARPADQRRARAGRLPPCDGGRGRPPGGRSRASPRPRRGRPHPRQRCPVRRDLRSRRCAIRPR